MVLKVMMLLGFFILSACVTKNLQSLINPPEKDLSEKVNQTTLDNKQPQERNTNISPDMLFLLMAAEIAGQRGQYDLALDSYLRASEQVKDIEVIRRAAKIALYVQDNAKFKQVIDLWLEEEPDSLDARYLVAVIALKSCEQQEAYNNIEYILLNGMSDLDARLISMSKNVSSPQSIACAYQVFADLSMAYPDNAQLYFVLAVMNIQAQKLRPAQKNITKALEIKPQWKKALFLQVQLYITQAKLAEATKVLQQLDQLETSVKIKEQIVQLLLQQGHFSEAEVILLELISKYPDNNEMQFKLALIYLQIGKDESARNILQVLVTDQAYKNRAAFYLGRMDGKAKRNDDALVWFDSITVGSYQYEAGFRSIFILMNEQRYPEVYLRIAKLKAEFPNKNIDLALIEAEAYRRQHLYQQGFDILTTVLVDQPNNKQALYARALIAEKLGMLQVLEDDLKYILQQNPNDANILNTLGYTLVDKTTRYKEAQGYLDKAIAIKPHDPIIMDSYGWLLFKLEELQEAKAYLQHAYKLAPKAEIAGHLVEVLWALQQYQQAKSLLREALKKDPDDTLLLELEARFLSGH